jgi:RNA polymerase sigma-70 factor (TIGR02960 family)
VAHKYGRAPSFRRGVGLWVCGLQWESGRREIVVVTDELLRLARAGDGEAFRELTEPYRRQLRVHCYRILGSIEDADDLVQETLLAAWRGLKRFEGRASLRAWLYRIATNRCLNALRDNRRRPRDLGALPEAPFDLPEPTRRSQAIWMQPYPDELLEAIPDEAPGPEARYEAREAVSLAFVAALQLLSPRQRAVLVLRDVLGYRAAEVADMLDSSQDSVNSALKRGRRTLKSAQLGEREAAPQPRSTAEAELVGRFADAFESGDVDAVIAMLTEDARYTMPPVPGEYEGREAIAALLRRRVSWVESRGLLVPTRANGQPAFGCYFRDPSAPVLRAQGLLVLTLEGDRISAITRFIDNTSLPYFGLPRTLPR